MAAQPPRRRDGLGTRVKLVANGTGGVDRQVWRNYGQGYNIAHQREIDPSAADYMRKHPRAKIEGYDPQTETRAEASPKDRAARAKSLKELIAEASPEELKELGLSTQQPAVLIEATTKPTTGLPSPSKAEHAGEPAETVQDVPQDPEAEVALPDSFPHADLLREVGVTTLPGLDKFVQENNLSQVKGFGPMRAQAINAARAAIREPLREDKTKR